MLDIIQSELFRSWRTSLKDRQALAKINARIRRLADGNAGDVKPVGHGVSELRIDFGPGYRIYYTKLNQVLVILLIGGDKRSQTTDIAKAIDLAKQLKE